MRRIKVKCSNCNKPIKKSISEYNRSIKIGRRFFCSRACSASKRNTELSKDIFRGMATRLVPDNRRDDLTPFRFYTHVIRNRKKESSIDETYLKSLWLKQNGICPYTGWKLILPTNVSGWINGLQKESASLDRIDSSKGYVDGNVQFVSVMANWAKNNRTDKELIEFCKAVAKKHN